MIHILTEAKSVLELVTMSSGQVLPVLFSVRPRLLTNWDGDVECCQHKRSSFFGEEIGDDGGCDGGVRSFPNADGAAPNQEHVVTLGERTAERGSRPQGLKRKAA